MLNPTESQRGVCRKPVGGKMTRRNEVWMGGAYREGDEANMNGTVWYLLQDGGRDEPGGSRG
jgi:hypothetical protein